MNRMMSSFVAGSVALFGAAMAQGVHVDELKGSLKDSGWDIIHTASQSEDKIVLGARSVDGWPVIHTLTGCAEGSCQGWVQSTPLSGGFVEQKVSYQSLAQITLNRVGNSLLADSDTKGNLVLRGVVLGRDCAADCLQTGIESFADASRVSYHGLTDTVSSHARGWGIASQATPVEMDHRQLAAIVTATETEAARTFGTSSSPEGETGTISFPPLLPE